MTKKITYTLTALLAIHFVFVLLVQCYQQNWNLFKINSIEEINSKYVNPYFEQNWAMFAPNPPHGNQFIVIQFYSKKDSTELINIHQKVLDNSLRKFFSIDQRILKYFNGCYNDILIKKSYNYKNDEFINKSHGLQSIMNYSRIVLSNQKSFIEKVDPKDSLYIDIYLVNEPLNDFKYSKQLVNKSYIDVDRVYLGIKKELQ